MDKAERLHLKKSPLFVLYLVVKFAFKFEYSLFVFGGRVSSWSAMAKFLLWWGVVRWGETWTK